MGNQIYKFSHTLSYEATGTFSPFNLWAGKGLSVLNHPLQVRIFDSVSLRSFLRAELFQLNQKTSAR